MSLNLVSRGAWRDLGLAARRHGWRGPSVFVWPTNPGDDEQQ